MDDITIQEEGDMINVYVSLPLPNKKSSSSFFEYKKIRTNDIIKFLKNKNVDYELIVKSDTAHNKFGNGKGHWIFKKKSVDKPIKQVTLKEEKPKTTRRRRTKKASTEE